MEDPESEKPLAGKCGVKTSTGWYVCPKGLAVGIFEVLVCTLQGSKIVL